MDVMSSDFLDTMIAKRRAAVGALIGTVMNVAIAGFGRETLDAYGALRRRSDVAVIAEFKKASPSAGPIAPDADPAERAAAYEAGGAAMMSVLTEPTSFGGSFDDIAAARKASDLPILCKDFVVHHNQLLLARAAGADAVLLMVSVLGERTVAFVTAARDVGLEPLVEVHGEVEYRLAAVSGARIIGVNARDLRTLEVDRAGTLEIIARAAADEFVVVAESGIRGRGDVEQAAKAGASAVLVGEALMRADDPAGAVRGMTGIGTLRRSALRT